MLSFRFTYQISTQDLESSSAPSTSSTGISDSRISRFILEEAKPGSQVITWTRPVNELRYQCVGEHSDFPKPASNRKYALFPAVRMVIQTLERSSMCTTTENDVFDATIITNNVDDMDLMLTLVSIMS